MKELIKLYKSGDEYTPDTMGKKEVVENIIGVGTAIVSYCRYQIEAVVEYSQSSGHGEILGYEYIYEDSQTKEFELSEDPLITLKNILIAVYGSDDDLVVYSTQIEIESIKKI